MKIALSCFATALVLLCIPAVCHAAITTTSGSMQLVTAPPSVQLGDFESSSYIRAFDEVKSLVLPQDLSVNLSLPGTYDDSSTYTPYVIPAGTIVQSHLIHFDKIGGTTELEKSGSVVFNNDILGLIVEDALLDSTDVSLGSDSTLYPVAESLRGIELDNVDTITLGSDLRTVSVELQVSNSSDQLRVVTLPEPSSLAMLGIAVLMLRRTR